MITKNAYMRIYKDRDGEGSFRLCLVLENGNVISKGVYQSLRALVTDLNEMRMETEYLSAACDVFMTLTSGNKPITIFEKSLTIFSDFGKHGITVYSKLGHEVIPFEYLYVGPSKYHLFETFRNDSEHLALDPKITSYEGVKKAIGVNRTIDNEGNITKDVATVIVVEKLGLTKERMDIIREQFGKQYRMGSRLVFMDDLSHGGNEEYLWYPQPHYLEKGKTRGRVFIQRSMSINKGFSGEYGIIGKEICPEKIFAACRTNVFSEVVLNELGTVVGKELLSKLVESGVKVCVTDTCCDSSGQDVIGYYINLINEFPEVTFLITKDKRAISFLGDVGVNELTGFNSVNPYILGRDIFHIEALTNIPLDAIKVKFGFIQET